MIKFVPYVQTIEGYIERQSYAVFNSPESNPLPYIYEEELPVGQRPRSFGQARQVLTLVSHHSPIVGTSPTG
jgi:hypothetical protein